MTARKKKPSAAGPESRPTLKADAWIDKPGRFALALSGFLFIALVVYFREFIFNSGVMIYGSDMITQAFQTRKLAVDGVASGSGIPLWNPFSYCGLPYLGALPGPIFFPTSILYHVMPLERAIGWSILLMMLAGGMFAYLWVKELGLSRWAGAFAAVAWAFTGWVASTLSGGHDGRQFTMLLLPLVMFCLERGLNRKKLVWFLLMGAAVAMQILSPHVQMMYYSSVGVSAWFVFRLALIYREKTPAVVMARLTAYFAAGFVFAVSLSAIQFVPTVVNQGYSHRQTGTELGYEGWNHATQYSMHPLETIGLAVPGFTGEPYSYWAGTSFKGHSEYMGLAVLMFALVALAYRRNRYTWFFAGLALTALLFNFGGYTPFFKLPYYLMPKVKDFRAPNMMFFVCGFSLLTLAAYGIDRLVGSREIKDGPEVATRVTNLLGIAAGVMLLGTAVLAAGKPVIIQVLGNMLPDGQARIPYIQQSYPQIVQSAFISMLVAAVIWATAWLFRSGRIGALLLAGILMTLTWGDLLRMDRHWLQVVHPSRVYVRDNIVQALEQEQEQYRVFFFPVGGNDAWDNSLLYFRIPTINASMPLRLHWYEELMGTFTFDNFRQHPRLWHMLNTRYVMVRQGDWINQFETVFGLSKVVEDSRTGRVLFANPEAWPRFRLFSRFEVLEDEKAFVPRFTGENFDWRNTLVLMEQPEFDSARLDGESPEGEVRLVRYTEEEVELTVTTSRPALLYAAETWHPSWTAELDGEPARIYRANLAMRAVFIEPGTHRLVMRYESAPYRWGRISTLLSLLLLAGVVGRSAYRKDW